MPTRSSSPSTGTVRPPVRLISLPLGERRDVKQDSPFHEAVSSARRSLAKELLADRKR